MKATTTNKLILIFGPVLTSVLLLLGLTWEGTAREGRKARAESAQWMQMAITVQDGIGANVARSGTLRDSGLDVDRRSLSGNGIERTEIRPNGIIAIKGGSKGQALFLIPQLQEDAVSWRCLGGSARAVPKECRDGGVVYRTVPLETLRVQEKAAP